MSTNSGLELSADRTAVVSFRESGTNSVTVPDTVARLPEGLFAHCSALKSVSLPNGLRDLPARLFEGCTGLESVRLPYEVTHVGEACFALCSSLKSAPLCPGMTEIAANMFKGCCAIDMFAVPEGVTAIRSGAFALCTSLETVVLSDTVVTIEDGAFEGCTHLRRVRVSDDNPAFYIEENDGMLRRKSDGEIVIDVNVSGQSVPKAATLLRPEAEVDLSIDDAEEDSEESLEAMDNNFIGEDDIVPIAAEASETAMTDDKTSSGTIKEDNVEDAAIAAKLDEIMGRHHEESAAGAAAAASNDELHRIEMENDILSQNLNGGAKIVAARGDELQRISLEDDILSQNRKEVAAGVGAPADELVMLSRESDILSQNTHVADHITLTQGEADAVIEGGEVMTEVPEGYYGAVAFTPKAPEPEAEEEAAPYTPPADPLLERMKNIAENYECITLDEGTDNALFVFAEKLVQGADGQKFSAPLLRCAKYLAKIHSLSKVHLFNGLPLDNPEFEQMFTQFIYGKDAVYACDASSTYGLTEAAKTFASAANVELVKSEMDAQRERVAQKGGLSFRLILQDDYSRG